MQPPHDPQLDTLHERLKLAVEWMRAHDAPPLLVQAVSVSVTAAAARIAPTPALFQPIARGEA